MPVLSRFIAVLWVPVLLIGQPGLSNAAFGTPSGYDKTDALFSREALSPVALDGSWHALLLHVPNPVYVLALWLGVASLSLPGLKAQYTPDAAAAWRPYIAQVANDLTHSPDAVRRQVGQTLLQRPVEIRLLDDSSLAGLTYTPDAKGNFPLDPSTKIVKFSLGMNPNFLNAVMVARSRMSTADQILLDRYLTSFVIKELGGLYYIQAHLELGPRQHQLYEWIGAEMKRLMGNSSQFSLSAVQLRDQRLVEPIEHYVGIGMGYEEAGYEDQFNFFTSHGLGPDALERLAARVASISPLVAANMQNAAKILRYLAAHPSDRFWAISLYHLHAFIADRGKSPGTAPILQTLRLAYLIEGAAGRAKLDANQDYVVTVNPQTGLPPATYMPYLRNPLYVRPNASEMKRIAPTVLKGLLVDHHPYLVAKAA